MEMFHYFFPLGFRLRRIANVGKIPEVMIIEIAAFNYDSSLFNLKSDIQPLTS